MVLGQLEILKNFVDLSNIFVSVLPHNNMLLELGEFKKVLTQDHQVDFQSFLILTRTF